MPCEKDWVDIMTALLTPTIAILGSTIAFLQWRINRLRLKHELFEKRYDIYSSGMAFLGSIVRSGKVSEEERINFLVGTKGAKFLFPQSINDYLDQIHNKSCDLQCLDAELEGIGISEQRSKNVKEQSEIKKWFYSQLSGITIKFKLFVELKH